MGINSAPKPRPMIATLIFFAIVYKVDLRFTDAV
jgi:hypothetical protein